MARTEKRPLRGVWRTIHLWIGAGLFVVLAPLGLTGSALVWEDGLDKLLHPVRYAVSAGNLAPSAYLDAAAQAFGDRAAPNQLRLPDSPDAPVIVTGAAPGKAPEGQRPQSLTAWIDPATGKVLDVGNPRQELRGWIHQLHGNLFMAQPGRLVVGWFGLLMLILCVTGLVVWWPRNHAVIKAMRWTRSSSGFGNLHHMVGFWVCVPLAILSLSGAYIAWPQQMRALTGQKPAPARPPNRDGASPFARPRLTADEALAAALAVEGGGARLASITLPTEGDRPAWRIQFKGRGGVRVDDASGKARALPAAPQQGPGNGDPIARVMRRLHDGSSYGPLWQAVIVLAGIAPTLLGVTGIVVWLTRRRRIAQGG